MLGYLKIPQFLYPIAEVGLGVFCAVLGIISGFTENPLVLGTIPWFLLAIAAFVASIPSYMGWAVAVYLHQAETKGKKEE